MSKIDYQKLREIAEKTKIAGEAPVMPFDQRINALNDFMKHFSPDIALALLDEVKRLEDTNIDAMCRIAEVEAREIKPAKGEVLVVVSGFTGCGKSAIAGEIEIAMKAIGVPVQWTNGDAEKRMTGADWLTAIEMYKPTVRIVEVNVHAPLAFASKESDMSTITKERIELFIKSPLDNGLTRGEQMELARIALASLEREQIRHEHAKWSDSTFGCVGPIGPLKHLSKEALEAAAEPDDLSEWADMQFLLWDAQRRAGISDAEITAAMENKLKINMERQWPEPKDGEPRLHIKERGNSPVTPDGWISCSEQMPDDGQHVIILCDGAFVLYAQYRDGEFFDVVRNGEEFFETQSRNVTDWMPLPEPPQGVNRC